MNRVINISKSHLKKVSTDGVRHNLIRQTIIPTISHRHQSTSPEPAPIVSKEFIPRRRTPQAYHAPTSRRPKPRFIIDKEADMYDDEHGLTVLGNESDNAYENMWKEDFKYKSIAKIDDVYKDDELAMKFNPYVADELRHYERLKQSGRHIMSYENVDSKLRIADWLTAEQGSTEDAMMMRRAYAESTWSEEERKELKRAMDDMVEKEREKSFDLPEKEFTADMAEVSEKDLKKEEEENAEEENSLVVGGIPWRDMVIDVNRVQKVTRSGTIVSYRSLVIGGNTRGAAGFGVGKGAEPDVATASAKRMCHRNIFFMDPYQGSGLTNDLVGKHNNCKVVIRAVSQGYGLQGNNLIQDILLAFGVTNATGKAYGRRNPYSVVYATFKAIRTHKSLESVALGRGKKFLSMDRMRRLEFK